MKNFVVVFCAVLAIVVLFGCAPTAPPSPTAPAATKPAAPPPSTAPSPVAPPTPTAPAVKTGGILRTWSMVTPPGFDMHRRPSYVPIFGMPIFNNLVQFDPTQVEISPATVQGDLAEKWDISADSKTYTFYLRKDVKWRDGTPFTADDVAYSIEKMMDKNRSSIWSDFPAYQSVAKVDDYTVKVNLKNPSASFLFQLAGPYASIQAKHKANVDFRSPDFLMGTGPFKFSKYTTGVLMEYVKNPNYFKKDSAGRQLPYLDGLTIHIFTDKSAALDGVVTKRLEGHASFSTNNQEEYDRVVSQNKDYVTTFYYPPGIALVWLNPNFAPFKDVRVREAMRLLLDKDLMVIAGYG
ncbi:MAG: ABC transporter substrate-binding protein, partial [Dehalococcoidia bacterium]|nr:ABC transporter substrate-binding protein [Dehalococcoidia bacterium]